MHLNPNPNIETQDTLHLPLTPPWQARKPSLKELRISCGISREELSQRAGVRLCRVDWMERGIESSLSDVLKVLLILSQATRCWYHIEDIAGVRLKAQADCDTQSGVK